MDTPLSTEDGSTEITFKSESNSLMFALAGDGEFPSLVFRLREAVELIEAV